MVHIEKLTVPLPPMYTPPPCKQQAKYESPIGAMGTFEVSGADGTYSKLVHRGSTHIIKDENRMDMSTRHFPIGAMGSLQAWLWEVLRMSTHISSCVASDGA